MSRGTPENRPGTLRMYHSVQSMIRFDPAEQWQLLRHLVVWVALGTVVGILAGGSSAAFLTMLEWATDTRTANDWLLYLLPLAGLAVGYSYHAYAGNAALGNNLLLEEIHEPTAWLPRRMAPMVLITTVITHLFGGSAGREGTAIQMSGSLSDSIVGRLARLTGADRRIMLIAAISGGFGAVFGVPIAGFVFGLEVQSLGRIRHDAIVPALAASIVGDKVVSLLNVEHTPVPTFAALDLTLLLTIELLAAGIAFGFVAIAFVELTHGCKHVMSRFVGWPPLRPFVGGLVVIALTFIAGTRDYLGLSVPLIVDAVTTDPLTGVAGVAAFAFAWKVVFTAVTLGSGFQGGEVTPLFVIGATLGATLGHLFGAPVGVFAAVGFVSVFAGATNTPIACTIMGVELFGGAIIVPLAIGCVTSYLFSSNRGIYGSQRVDRSKLGPTDTAANADGTLSSIASRRKYWLPDRGSDRD